MGGASVRWRCRSALFSWGSADRARVVGVVNVTPDSFSDGGRFCDPRRAIAHGLALVAAGAEILDVGGESSRPGAQPVSAAVERDRVLPVIEALAARAGVPVSVDTCKVEVARDAVDAGASIINDIMGLQDPAMASLVAERGVGAVVMHMRGRPETMQLGDLRSPDMVAEVVSWARARLAALCEAGVSPEQVCLDPGLGFGKTVAQNAALIAGLPRLLALGRPVLVGASNKSFLGAVTGREVGARGAATTAAHSVAAFLGAQLLRVHEVEAAVDAAQVVAALREAGA